MADTTTKTEFVPWYIWIWTVSIATLIIMALFGYIRSVQAKVETVQASQQEISIQLSQIQADLKNIDARLIEIRQDFKNHVK